MTGTEEGESERPAARPRSVADSVLYGVQYELPSTLDAFYRTYARPQIRYAAAILGDEDAAKEVVRQLYRHLALSWPAIQLEGCGPEAYAWRALKRLVDDQVRETVEEDLRSVVLTARDTAAVHEAVRAMLGVVRAQMADLDCRKHPSNRETRPLQRPFSHQKTQVNAGATRPCRGHGARVASES